MFCLVLRRIDRGRGSRAPDLRPLLRRGRRNERGTLARPMNDGPGTIFATCGFVACAQRGVAAGSLSVQRVRMQGHLHALVPQRPLLCQGPCATKWRRGRIDRCEDTRKADWWCCSGQRRRLSAEGARPAWPGRRCQECRPLAQGGGHTLHSMWLRECKRSRRLRAQTGGGRDHFCDRGALRDGLGVAAPPTCLIKSEPTLAIGRPEDR